MDTLMLMKANQKVMVAEKTEIICRGRTTKKINYADSLNRFFLYSLSAHWKFPDLCNLERNKIRNSYNIRRIKAQEVKDQILAIFVKITKKTKLFVITLPVQRLTVLGRENYHERQPQATELDTRGESLTTNSVHSGRPGFPGDK